MSGVSLQFERRGAVGILTLNRPDRLNALDLELVRSLLAFFAARADDYETRVLVRAGAGRAFCAGLDLRAVPEQLPWRPGLGALPDHYALQAEVEPSTSRTIEAAPRSGGGSGRPGSTEWSQRMVHAYPRQSRRTARDTMTTDDPATFYDLIRTKRDARAFADRPIPEGTLRRILQAGRMAGSARHAQPCRFIVLRDPQHKAELAACGDFTDPVRAAPVAIAIVVLPDAGQWDPMRATAFDAGRAAQNMMLAAWAERVGSRPTTMHRHEDAARVLGLPAGHRVTWVLAFGYPAEEGEDAPARRPRLPFAEYVHHERWGGSRG